jgi:flagellin-specific chaperone FliS
MIIEEAKEDYNKLLQRFHKANEYFDKKDIPQSEKEKFLGNYQEILRGLNYYLGKIEVYTNQEVMKEFHG